MAEIDEPNGDEPTPYRDPVGLHGVHLLTCRSLWHDAQRTDGAFGLAGIMTHIEPSEEASFPVSLNRVFVYVQLWGDAGEYTLRIRLVRVILEDDDEVEVQIGMNDEPREYPLPSRRPVVVSGLNYVDELGFPIGPVAFPEPGLYEYQLIAEGIKSPIARERVLAREWTDDE